MPRKGLIQRQLVLTVLFFMVLGCAATLAPTYDKALFEGLTASNSGVMEFFASVAGGTTKETFEHRQARYANLIGRFDAMEIQARARPVPNTKVTAKINEILTKRGLPIPDDNEIPSAVALGKISGTLAKMRDTDKKQGVTATEVQAFRNQVAIYLDQALTYESFLER